MGFGKQGLKAFDKIVPVFIIPEYLLALYPPYNNMVKNARPSNLACLGILQLIAKYLSPVKLFTYLRTSLLGI